MIIDAHAHFDTPEVHDAFIADINRSGFDQVNILAYEPQSTDADAFLLPAGYWLKNKHPDRVFLFGGLDTTGILNGGTRPEEPLDQQIHELIECGCDGLKLLLGKPTSRKFYGHPLTSPIYKPLLDTLESTGFPTLWHVNDPPEFWSEHTVPLWARQNRWWYDDTHPTYEQINHEMFAVLDAHPKLNLIIPHFFFHSDKLDAAAVLLKKYPNVSFDLAPGVEMLHNFTANYDASREFFIKYADRIIFGTDIGIDNHRTGAKRGDMCRRFLETGDRFQVPDDPFMTPDPRPDLHGLKLPKDALDQIFHKNFQKKLGHTQPKPLNKPLVKEALQKMESNARARGSKSPLATKVLPDF